MRPAIDFDTAADSYAAWKLTHRPPLWKRALRRLFMPLSTFDWCPVCKRETAWSWEKWNPIHADGPPLAAQWRCRTCDFETGYTWTSCIVDAARSYPNSELAQYVLSVPGPGFDDRDVDKEGGDV